MRLILLCSAAALAFIAGAASAQTQPGGGQPTSPSPDPTAATATSAPVAGQNGPGKAPSENPSEASANANASSGPASSTPTGSGLGDIIVTAQRREESLQRAAVSVNVARGADLIAAGVTEPYRLAELAPGLTIQPTGTGNLIFIRGVGNLTTTPNSEPRDRLQL